jgi:hypothetical protein
MVERVIIERVCDIDYFTPKTSRENTTMNKCNSVNSCGSVSPAVDVGKEVGLFSPNIQNCNTQLLSRKKTYVFKDRIYGFC